ncbi:MAG: roadblock/LC7 domain-containing protein [Candidatus Hodarchaeota archaeon]
MLESSLSLQKPVLERVNQILEVIKESIPSIDGIFLTQRDGNPIASTGVYLAQDEILSVSAGTAAIYNACLVLHGNLLEHLVIDGVKAKILIQPLTREKNYFLTITYRALLNMGHVYKKLKPFIEQIQHELESSGCDFTPPLREYNEKKLDVMMAHFKSKASKSEGGAIPCFSYRLTGETQVQSNNILNNMNKVVQGFMYGSVAFTGGFLLTWSQKVEKFNLTPDCEIALSFSIWNVARSYLEYLKKTSLQSIYMDCGEYAQFINAKDDLLLSLYIIKGVQVTGFLRLTLIHYLDLLIQNLRYTEKYDLEQASEVT